MFQHSPEFRRQYRLDNDTATVYEISPSFTTSKVGLIISDHHLDRSGDGVADSDLLFRGISILLSHFKPDYILMLGDTLEWDCVNPSLIYDYLFEGLSKFQLPIFVVSGNHDRDFLQEYNKDYPLITILRNDLAMSIRTMGCNGNLNRIVFAHDFGNRYHVFRRHKQAFMRWMRDVFSSLFEPNDLLCFGHTHLNILDEEYRCYSIAPFAPSYGMYDWGIVREDKGFKIEMMSEEDWEKLENGDSEGK
jgi:predicted phosphodiesterase